MVFHNNNASIRDNGGNVNINIGTNTSTSRNSNINVGSNINNVNSNRNIILEFPNFLTGDECIEFLARVSFVSAHSDYPPFYRNNMKYVRDSSHLVDRLFSKLKVQMGLNIGKRNDRVLGKVQITHHIRVPQQL